MATVEKDIADKLIANNGYFLDDVRVHRIVEYTDIGGKQAYGLEYEYQLGKYHASPWVRDPKVIWQANPHTS
jgi:hypothetical protein